MVSCFFTTAFFAAGFAGVRLFAMEVFETPLLGAFRFVGVGLFVTSSVGFFDGFFDGFAVLVGSLPALVVGAIVSLLFSY